MLPLGSGFKGQSTVKYGKNNEGPENLTAEGMCNLTKLLILIVVGILAATVVSGIVFYLEMGSDAGAFLRDELRHYALVFGICYALMLFGGELAGKRGVLVGMLIAVTVYIVMMPAPQGDLGENRAAQTRLGDLHNWLEWLLAIALAASARFRYDATTKQINLPNHDETLSKKENTSANGNKSQSKRDNV